MAEVTYKPTNFENYVFELLSTGTPNTEVSRSYMAKWNKRSYTCIVEGVEMTLEKKLPSAETGSLVHRLSNPNSELIRIREGNIRLVVQTSYIGNDGQKLPDEKQRIKLLRFAKDGKIKREYFPKKQSGYIMDLLRRVKQIIPTFQQ